MMGKRWKFTDNVIGNSKTKLKCRCILEESLITDFPTLLTITQIGHGYETKEILQKLQNQPAVRPHLQTKPIRKDM